MRRSSVALLLVLARAAPAPAQEGARPPAPVFDPDDAVRRGCGILLTLQEGEGRREWPYEGVYRVSEPGSEEDVIPIGYRVGGTAIVCLALVAAPDYSGAEGAERRAAVGRGVGFVLEALELPLMEPSRKDQYDVRGWGHVYALQLFATLEARALVPAEHVAGVKRAIPRLVRALEETALEDGGWNYSGRHAPAPFMTAPALQALFAAAMGGHVVSKRVIEAALDALERGRARSGGIAYTTPRRSRAKTAEEELGFMDRLPCAAGRMLACESVLTLAGRGDAERLAAAVRAFFAHWDELESRRKQTGTHVEPYGVAPYYVLFAHHQAAQAIELLADPAERALRRDELRALLARIQEPEGGWNDRVFARSRSFGTALCMLVLLQPELEPPARWGRGVEKR